MTIYSNVSFTRSLNGVAISLQWESLPEASRTFLADYGLKQYLQDGAAMASVEELNKNLAKSRNGKQWTEAERDEKIREKLEARIQSLKDGTPSTRERGEAEPDTPEYRAAKIVAWPYLEKILEGEGIKIKKLKPAEIAAYVDQIKAEAAGGGNVQLLEDRTDG